MDTKEFEMLAKQYETMNVSDLEEEFEKQLSLAETGINAATRGGSFWDEMKYKIVEGMLQNRDLGSATLGMITSEVLIKLTAAGVDLTQYKLVIAVFIGLVARAFWFALEERSKRSSDKK